MKAEAPLRVLYAASEAHPLVKTGGLADVAGALPRALRNLGHDLRLVLPAYPAALERAAALRTAAAFQVDGRPLRLLEGRLPGTRVHLYLVDCPALFHRPGHPYLDAGGRPWPDNAERFYVFARAVAELACDRLGRRWRPHVVHCNDWQTGLVPALLALEPVPPAVVFTVHNLAYQGLFPHATFTALGLPDAWWSYRALEFHGQLSFIKGGLVFAHRINTVSPTYAREIMTPALGCGLDGLLRHRADRVSGILNGIDTGVWNPARDPHLAARFHVRRLAPRADNRRALQRRLGLDPDDEAVLAGHVGRLVEQKGADIILDALPRLLALGMQVAVLGSGEAALEQALREAARTWPGRVAVHLGHDEALAHLMEGGADLFLMPSRFEPCGLNQLYSLRYGAVPVVHRVGGLADTVTDAGPAALAAGEATGFVFDAPEPGALAAAVERAVALRRDARAWTRLQQAGMRQDHSWRRRAGEYLALYRRALADAGPAR